MKPLDYAEMGILKRRHGITVTRQVAGVAYVLHRDGGRRDYPIKYLRAIAGRRWNERLRDWLCEVTA